MSGRVCAHGFDNAICNTILASYDPALKVTDSFGSIRNPFDLEAAAGELFRLIVVGRADAGGGDEAELFQTFSVRAGKFNRVTRIALD